jgi:hypothetical protein
MALQDEYSPGYFLDRYADLLESIQTGDLTRPGTNWPS